MSALVSGQNIPLSDSALTITSSGGLDLSAILCGSDGKVRSDDDFVFFNAPAAPGVRLDGATLHIDLAGIDSGVQSVVLVASAEDGGPLSAVPGGVSVSASSGSDETTFAPTFTSERAASLMEVYRRGDGWKLRATGQGWNDGLAGLARDYGVDVDDDGGDAAPAPETPAPAPLEKPTTVRLEKPGQSRSVSLDKTTVTHPFHVNLNWTPGGGLLSRKMDLDLGVFIETKDGRKDVIQPLGGSFGSQDGWPWILLDQDDRSGASANGENLKMYRPGEIKRALIFALIYGGVSDFSSANAVVTITDTAGASTVIELNDAERGKKFAVVAMVTSDGDNVTFTKETGYFASHEQADEAYGFGFHWHHATK